MDLKLAAAFALFLTGMVNSALKLALVFGILTAITAPTWVWVVFWLLVPVGMATTIAIGVVEIVKD